jgi:hypothetical protein
MEPRNEENTIPERVRIRLDVLDNIIEDLNTNAELEEIFGYPAINSLVIVAENNDLRIEADKEGLNDEQTRRFLEILDEIIKKNSSELGEI